MLRSLQQSSTKRMTGPRQRRRWRTPLLQLEGLEERSLPAANLASASWATVVPADLDGDGKVEMVGRVQQTGNWWATRGDGTFYSTTSLGQWNPAHSYTNVHAADLDGDSKDELVGRDAMTGDWLALAHHAGHFSVQNLANWPAADSFNSVRILDWNDDDKDEIIGWDQTTGDWHLLGSGVDGIADQVIGHWDAALAFQNIIVADLNGNDRKVLLGWSSVTGDWHALSFQGTAWQDAVVGNWPASHSYQSVMAANLFGNDRQEVVGRDSATGQWYALDRQGGVTKTIPLSQWPTSSKFQFVRAADIDGDGAGEIIGRSVQTGTWWAIQNQNGSWANIRLATWLPSIHFAYVGAGDVDGDGKADLIGFESNSGYWIAAVHGGKKTIVIGAWNPANSYQSVQFLDLNKDGKTDVFGVLPSTAAFWTIQTQGNNFVNLRLASWNTDLHKNRIAIASDAQLKELIRSQVPALVHPALLSTLAEAILLRDWAANAYDWALDSTTQQQAFSKIKKRAAYDLYANVFLTDQGGGYCDGCASFGDKVFKLFGLNSFIVDLGNESNALTHVTDVVGISDNNGGWKYYVVDPTFNGTFIKANGQFATVRDLVRAGHNQQAVQFVAGPIDGRSWVGISPFTESRLKLIKQSSHHYVYQWPDYQFSWYLASYSKALVKAGYSLSFSIFAQLLDAEIFRVGHSIDPTASSGFSALMRALGVPVSSH